MITILPFPLTELVRQIFLAAGCASDEAACVSEHVVEANLAGHDSHGVIRVPLYVRWLREGKILANRKLCSVVDNGAVALVDGRFGFGQVMGRDAMLLAIEKAGIHGVAMVGLRHSGHLGRIGHFAELAAHAGFIALCFVNTTGSGVLAAPFGGIDRRLSANPLAVGIPNAAGSPIVLDISTCAIAEGKIRVALNKGESVPGGCLIDHTGRPTNDPEVFYGDPPGAILPFGGHKGFGLSLAVDILAGALTGGGCTRAGVDRLEQGMLILALDPARFVPRDGFGGEVARFIAYVRTSRTTAPGVEILMPGEPEQRSRLQRRKHGIEIDENTWRQLVESCQSLGVPDEFYLRFSVEHKSNP